jgi:hypothetical protein
MYIFIKMNKYLIFIIIKIPITIRLVINIIAIIPHNTKICLKILQSTFR